MPYRHKDFPEPSEKTTILQRIGARIVCFGEKYFWDGFIFDILLVIFIIGSVSVVIGGTLYYVHIWNTKTEAKVEECVYKDIPSYIQEIEKECEETCTTELGLARSKTKYNLTCKPGLMGDQNCFCFEEGSGKPIDITDYVW